MMDAVTISPPPVYYYGSGLAPIMPQLLRAPYVRSSPPKEISNPYKSTRDAIIAAARLVYGNCTAKRWARAAGVEEITAKVWLSGRVPEARIKRLAASLLTELESTRARLNEVETALQAIAQGRLK